MKLVDFLDFQQNEARQIVLHPKAVAPASFTGAVTGQVYTQTGGSITGFSAGATGTATTSAATFMAYNGTSWVRLDNIYNTAADIIGLNVASAPNGIAGTNLVAGNILMMNPSGKIVDSGIIAANVSMSGHTHTISGDVTGTITGTSTVVAIQGKAVTLTSIAAGQILVYNGTSSFLNKTVTTTLTGDVSGTANMTANGLMSVDVTVDAIKGVAVPALATGNLKYNGSAWIFDHTEYLTAATGVTSVNTFAGAITIASGTGISVGNAAGTITITNSGVTSIVAGTNVTVSGATGAVTVGTSLTPSFTNITLSGSGVALTYAATPSLATDIITYGYLQGYAFGLRDFKESARVATTVNLAVTATATTLTFAVGVLVIDGVTVALNDRILVKNQTTAKDNGIFRVSTLGTASVAAVLTRTSDFNNMTSGTGNISSGAFIYVSEGTAGQKTGWVMSSTDASLVTLGTSDITWTQYSGSGTYIGGANISISGNTIALSSTLTGITSITTAGITIGTLTGMLKAASGVVSVAVAGTDYLAPASINGTQYTIVKYGATGITASLLTDNATTLTYTGAGGLVTPALKIASLGGVLIATTGTVSALSILTTTYGGTGLNTYTAGDMLYYASGTALSKLAKGTAGQLLGMNIGGTAPEYKTISSGNSLLSVDTSVAGAITLTIDTSKVTTEFNMSTFTFAATPAATVTANPTLFYAGSALNVENTGCYLLEVAHNLGSIPSYVTMIDTATGESYMCTWFATTAAGFNVASPTYAAKTTTAVIRLSAIGALAMASKSVKIIVQV